MNWQTPILGVAAGCLPPPAAVRKVVFIIITDDINDALDGYGSTAVKAPNMDALAAVGFAHFDP